MSTAFIAREIFTGHEIVTGHAILVKEGKIIDLLPVDDIPANYRSINLNAYMLAPAFMTCRSMVEMENCFPPN